MKHNLRKIILNPFTLLFCGLLLGVISRLFDIYTQCLGDIFSQPAVWILLGTLIAVYSPTRVRATLNILPFCLGMIATYYITAELTKKEAIWVADWTVIQGWTIFALLSPLPALLAWQTKERGIFSRLLGAGIVAISFLSSVLFFGGPRVYDFIINGILIYFIFFKKIER